MAENRKKKKKKDEDEAEKGRWHEGLRAETIHSIWAIICLGFCFLLILSLFDKAGLAGVYIHRGLDFLFGRAVFLAPLVFLFAAISFLVSFKPNIVATNFIGAVMFLISALALSDVIFGEQSGGYVGFVAALPLLKLVDFWASLAIFSAIFIIGILIMFNTRLSFGFLNLRRGVSQQALSLGGDDVIASNSQIDEHEAENETVKEEEKNNNGDASTEENNNSSVNKEALRKKHFFDKKFQPPPLELLESDKGRPSGGDIKANANIIKRTLQNFGIVVEMAEVRIGPSVTQYSFKPAEGIKLSRITALNNDLALALASHPIRIEAPIPGKSLVGIEVPNKSASLVGLRHLLGGDEFQKSDKPLMIALGRNVAGKQVYSSMAKMPHLLVAGATGSGKSVCIHALIMGLLYRHSPRDLQMLLVDPKRVELNVYNNIPYLLAPVITEAKKAIMALKWATREMERRYDILLAAGARDIHSYREKNKDDTMPYIIIIIDELADIMATYPREFEASIVRLAQMSRAVGIHLVVSTQRPSVEVITGLIKANITTRIAFQVASQVDSRTVLDMAGAEKLLCF